MRHSTEGITLVSPAPLAQGMARVWLSLLRCMVQEELFGGFLSLLPEHIHGPGDGAYRHFDSHICELEGIFTIRPRSYRADMGIEAQKEAGTHLRSLGLICNTSVRLTVEMWPHDRTRGPHLRSVHSGNGASGTAAPAPLCFRLCHGVHMALRVGVLGC